MTTWQEIGQENLEAAQNLYDGKRYRSSVSRCYYAVFSLLTFELTRGGVVFRSGRQTPAHAELSDLIVEGLTRFSEQRRINIASLTFGLYRRRIGADYLDQRVSRIDAEKALRDAGKLFRYFGVLGVEPKP